MLPGLALSASPSHRQMRKLILALGMTAIAASAAACPCFSAEMRIKTGRETLQLAQLAVFGAVVAMQADGTARIEVLESFKGAAPGTIITLQPGTGTCTEPMPPLGGKVLVIGFDRGLNACNQYDADYVLLEVFRFVAAQPS